MSMECDSVGFCFGHAAHVAADAKAQELENQAVKLRAEADLMRNLIQQVLLATRRAETAELHASEFQLHTRSAQIKVRELQQELDDVKEASRVREQQLTSELHQAQKASGEFQQQLEGDCCFVPWAVTSVTLLEPPPVTE